MVSTNEFKSGMVVRWNEDLYQILSYQHVKMQQRAPIVKTKLLRLKTGQVTDQAFRSGEKFDEVYLDRKAIQYLYREGSRFHFMDTDTFHDLAIHEGVIGDKTRFMKENDEVTGVFCDGELVQVELASSVALKVTQTEPGVRGDTAKSGTKPATLETGAVVRVPLFIRAGDVVRINTVTGEYQSRA